MSTQFAETVINKDDHQVTITVKAERETMDECFDEIMPAMEQYRKLLTADIQKQFEKPEHDIDGYEEFYANGGSEYLILEVEK